MNDCSASDSLRTRAHGLVPAVPAKAGIHVNLAKQDSDSYNADMVSDEVLNEVKQRLVDGFHPCKIILFGSQARGTADGRSDVDILVLCPVAENRRALTLAMDRSLWGLGLARDIVVLTPEEYERDRKVPGTIARPAFLEGRVLYESAT